MKFYYCGLQDKRRLDTEGPVNRFKPEPSTSLSCWDNPSVQPVALNCSYLHAHAFTLEPATGQKVPFLKLLLITTKGTTIRRAEAFFLLFFPVYADIPGSVVCVMNIKLCRVLIKWHPALSLGVTSVAPLQTEKSVNLNHFRLPEVSSHQCLKLPNVINFLWSVITAWDQMTSYMDTPLIRSLATFLS